MPLTTATLTLAADLLGAELDGRKAGDDPTYTAELAAARLELLLELRHRTAGDEATTAALADAATRVRAQVKATGTGVRLAEVVARRRVTP
jgi:hypothetical protein